MHNAVAARRPRVHARQGAENEADEGRVPNGGHLECPEAAIVSVYAPLAPVHTTSCASRNLREYPFNGGYPSPLPRRRVPVTHRSQSCTQSGDPEEIARQPGANGSPHHLEIVSPPFSLPPRFLC